MNSADKSTSYIKNLYTRDKMRLNNSEKSGLYSPQSCDEEYTLPKNTHGHYLTKE